MNITLVNKDVCDNVVLSPWQDWYHEHNRNSDCLLIAAGDSWTWGWCLADDLRLQQIYGGVIAEKLNSDFINIGLLGGDNLSIIYAIDYIISILNKKYKKIYIVCTLTENGRELRGLADNFAQSYCEIKGPDWPELSELLAGDASNYNKTVFALNELKSTSPLLRKNMELLLKIRNVPGPYELLECVDFISINYLAEVVESTSKENIQWLVGKNYVRWIESHNHFLNKVIRLEQIWTDVIASCGNLQPYPDSIIGGVTGNASKPLIAFFKDQMTEQTKKDLIKLFDTNISAADWFDQSEYNNPTKRSARHPLAIAHRWWAEYIYNNLNHE